MARKKKTNNVVTQAESIGYKGEVTLTLMHGNKRVRKIKSHNIGKAPLFQYLMYCLTGTLISTKIPRYLRVFNSQNQELTTRIIPSTGTPSYEFSDDEASAVITFNVSSTALVSLNDLKIFKLYSGENSTQSLNPSAEISIENAISIDDDSSLVIAWKMTISNK